MLSGVLLPFVTVSQETDGLVTTAKEICWATTVDWTPMARPEGKVTAPVVSSKAAVAEERIRSAEICRMVTEKPLEPVVPAASVTVTVAVKSPAVVGVPEMVPPESSATPAGNAPPDTAHLYGAIPPVAASWTLGYSTPNMPEASGDFDVMTMGAGLTVMLAPVLAVPPEESVTRAAKPPPPGAIGVPDTMPFAPKERPSGRLPDSTDQD